MQLMANLPDAEATEVLGVGLARACRELEGSGVLYLSGDLGAGKTTCVRALLREFGVSGLIRSPTYTLLDTYEVGARSFIHIDLYRLRAVSEVEELALRDLMSGEYLFLIEWPEKGAGAVPKADLSLALTYSGAGRLAVLTRHTPLGEGWVQHLARDTRFAPYVSNLT